METLEENPLEESLRRAADDPAHRPDFFRLLLESSVYIIGETEAPGSGEITVEAGEKLAIQNWEKSDGSPVIPFFTSLNALRRAIKDEVGYVSLPTRTLFDITRGSCLYLNPKSPYGKEFFAQEIEALLAGGTNRAPEAHVTNKATQVLLGQPGEYPSTMIAALSKFFATRSNVNAAYLALMHDPSRYEKPHLVVGIDAGGDIEQVMREAGVVAGDTCPAGSPLDLYRVDPKDTGLSQYFIEQVPFYKRATWGSKLTSLLGIGKG